MLLEIDMPQRSEEWHHLRRFGLPGNPYRCALGCSDLAVLAGVSPYATRRDLWRDKALGIGREVSAAEERIRERGRRREPALLTHYRAASGVNAQPAVLIDEDRPWLIASLDGWAFPLVVEIKVAAMAWYEEVCAGCVPMVYRPQLFGQLITAGIPYLHLLVEPFVGGVPVILPVELEAAADFPGAATILEQAEAFCESVTTGKEEQHGG
jgi:putative phage-type endonuclease